MPTSDFIGISGSGVYFPRRQVSVKDLAAEYKLDYNTIVEDHGVRNLHVATEAETEFFMATKAFENAVVNANLRLQDIDLIIYCAGLARVKSARSYSARLIEHFGIEAIGFDINAGFIGGLIGLQIANDMLLNSVYFKNAVVVASQEFDEMVVIQGHRLKDMIFGDGAAAVVLAKGALSNKIVASNFIIDHYSNFIDTLFKEEGQEDSALKKLFNSLDVLAVVRKLKGSKHMSTLTERWVRNSAKAVRSCLSSINLDIKDVDHFVKTQLSLLETRKFIETLQIEHDRIYNVSHEKGHLGHADILCNLHTTLEIRSLRNMDIVVLVAANYDCSSGALILRI